MWKKATCFVSCLVVLSVVASRVAWGADARPVGWWTFDDGTGTVARDASGNGNHGTLYGDPQWGEGQLDGALQFDGAGDYVELPIGSVIDTLEEATLTLWVNWSGAGGAWQRILDLGSGTTSYMYLCPNNGATNALRMAVTAGNSVWDEFDSSEGALATGWHHVAVTCSSSTATMTMYVDGQLVGTLTNITNTLDALGATTQNWVGRSQYDADPYFNGAVDDLRIYEVVLSEDGVATAMRGLSASVASNPAPADKAVDVPRDVVLGWTAGESVAAHDVYFAATFEDVNNADRANPLGVVVSQGQSGTSYDPAGLLEFGQTYYWRVDEVNAAPDSTIFKGQVWTFTAEPFVYPVENIVATSNGTSDAGMGPERTVDGSGLNEDDQHGTAPEDMWVATMDGAEPIYIQYEFDRVYKLYEMQVWNYNVLFELMLGIGFKDVTVEYSTDGVDWTVLKDVQFAQATARTDYTANTVVDFEGVAARYVRLTAHTAHGMAGRYGLSEVRFLYIPAHAREPRPADGAADVGIDTMLAWRAGREADSHDVYFGTDAEALPLVDAVTDNRYAPSGLDLATTYYWRIDEVNEAEVVSTWAGGLWNFTTVEYLSVDDFESYTDEEGQRIYETWVDGEEIASNGAQVGYLEGPFAEQTIVHGGRQSMPLLYNNVGGISSSEAELVLDVAQDWTQAGVSTLTLSFYGDLDNDAAEVYVKIGGTKISGGGSTALALWKQWNIDLAATGASLQNVTSITVGVEGTGTGVIYVDDIRLYRFAPDVVTPADPGAGNLALHYAFENDIVDQTGNGYDGTPMDTLFYADAAGSLGRALSFDGIDDYVELPIGALIGSLSDITVALWVDVAESSISWQRIFDFGTSSSAGYLFLCPRTGTNGPVRVAITPTGGAGESFVESATNLTPGWHHLAVVIDSAAMTISLYVDGALAASGATTTLPRDLGVPTQNWLGRSQYEADGYFAGLLADFSIYDSALSAGEVRYLAGDR